MTPHFDATLRGFGAWFVSQAALVFVFRVGMVLQGLEDLPEPLGWLAVLVLVAVPVWLGSTVGLRRYRELIRDPLGIARRPYDKRMGRYPIGHCQTCGYNLTGNVSGACPECGTAVGDARADPRE
jgi:hypothetical protein